MTEQTHDRRQHERIALGLPVHVHLSGRPEPVMVELLDISESGARFQANRDQVRVAQRVDFGFVVPDQPSCRAIGHVVRVEGSGQFVLALDEANDSFVGFVRLLCAET